METERMKVMTKWTTAFVCALALLVTLLPTVGFAGAKLKSNEQLIQATKQGDLGEVKTLLAKGADVNSRDRNGWTPLLWAAYYGHRDLVRLLLDSGADSNAKGKAGHTALIEAASYGNTEVLKLLLDGNSDVNAQDARGWTGLRHAAANAHADAVELLKSNGAKLTLIVAAILGDKQAAFALLESGADPDRSDWEGSTPLIEAIRHKNVDLVRLLVDRGANVNKADNSDQTPLMMAALTGQSEVIKLLLAKGADEKAKDAAGWSVLSYSKGSHHREVVELLKKARAYNERAERAPESTTTVPKAIEIPRRGKYLKGELVSCTARRLSIRVSDRRQGEDVNVEVRSTTSFVPFRRPAVGEQVEVRYIERNGTKIADQVRILPER